MTGLPTAGGAVETVIVDAVFSSNSKALIVRGDDTVWLVEYGAGCPGLRAGGSALVVSPDGFGGSGPELYLPPWRSCVTCSGGTSRRTAA